MEWVDFIKQQSKLLYFKELLSFLNYEYKNFEVYPKRKDIFNAFRLCTFSNLKVVIIGQDVYHNPNQAQGLAFSVPVGMKQPPSLVNIFKELKYDLSIDKPTHGNLTEWATQGVLLLNSILTVRKNQPASHKNSNWQLFTDNVIKEISNKKDKVVFILWGNFARNKKSLINNSNHLILEGAHPSPFSAKHFFGGRYFSKCNEFLKQNKIEPINWKLSNF